jgi:dienelactone hydrolase
MILASNSRQVRREEAKMLNYHKGSDTLIVVLHEIYGINGHITKVCKALAEEGYDVICPDLLDGKPPFDYDREEDAYLYFMNFVGLEASAKRTTFLLRQEEGRYKNIVLLGFSVGATVAWLSCVTAIKGDENFHFGGSLINCSGMICYYGSRIRDYTEVALKCPALLIFGEQEKSFDPRDLQKELEPMEQATVHILKGSHGFADPDSPYYNVESAKEADRLVRDFIEQIKGAAE